MTTRSALGSRFFVDGYDVSGAVSAIQTLKLGVAPLDVTTIDVSATKRLRGRVDGEMSFNVLFDDAAGAEHAALKAVSRSDRHAMWAMLSATPAIGDPAFAMKAKQMSYDWAVGADGGILGTCQLLATAAPLESGVLLTPGKRTDTGATNGSSLDGSAATNFGLSAYCFVTNFSGTDITIALQDSADNASFAAITGGSFGAFSAIGAARLQTAVNGAVRRYVRVVTTTSGGFTTCTFIVMFVRHPVTPPLWA